MIADCSATMTTGTTVAIDGLDAQPSNSRSRRFAGIGAFGCADRVCLAKSFAGYRMLA
jgi:hypothetical protein